VLNVLIVIAWLQIPKPQGTTASMMWKGTMWNILFFKVPQQVNLGRCLCDVNVVWGMCVSNLACEIHGCVCLCVFVSISTCVDILEKSLCAIDYGSRWMQLVWGVWLFISNGVCFQNMISKKKI